MANCCEVGMKGTVNRRKFLSIFIPLSRYRIIPFFVSSSFCLDPLRERLPKSFPMLPLHRLTTRTVDTACTAILLSSPTIPIRMS